MLHIFTTKEKVRGGAGEESNTCLCCCFGKYPLLHTSAHTHTHLHAHTLLQRKVLCSLAPVAIDTQQTSSEGPSQPTKWPNPRRPASPPATVRALVCVDSFLWGFFLLSSCEERGRRGAGEGQPGHEGGIWVFLLLLLLSVYFFLHASFWTLSPGQRGQRRRGTSEAVPENKREPEAPSPCVPVSAQLPGVSVCARVYVCVRVRARNTCVVFVGLTHLRSIFLYALFLLLPQSVCLSLA